MPGVVEVPATAGLASASLVMSTAISSQDNLGASLAVISPPLVVVVTVILGDPAISSDSGPAALTCVLAPLTPPLECHHVILALRAKLHDEGSPSSIAPSVVDGFDNASVAPLVSPVTNVVHAPPAVVQASPT